MGPKGQGDPDEKSKFVEISGEGLGTLNGGRPSISGGLGGWFQGALLRMLLICICHGPAHGQLVLSIAS